jgi:hypothetical protein
MCINKSTTFYYNQQKDSNGKRCCKRIVVAEVLSLMRALQALFVSQAIIFSSMQ